MQVTMSDVDLNSLIKRCREKESQGYDYVAPIQKSETHRAHYTKGYKGQFKRQSDDSTTKFIVTMRRG